MGSTRAEKGSKGEVEKGGRAHRIHCGSSVTISPGVTIEELESLMRLEGRVSSIEVSPSES